MCFCVNSRNLPALFRSFNLILQEFLQAPFQQQKILVESKNNVYDKGATVQFFSFQHGVRLKWLKSLLCRATAQTEWLSLLAMITFTMNSN